MSNIGDKWRYEKEVWIITKIYPSGDKTAIRIENDNGRRLAVTENWLNEFAEPVPLNGNKK